MSKHRLESLSDGVYAVAMTLLVLDLHGPKDAGPLTDAALQLHLRSLLPNLFSWVVSFIFLAAFWMSHQRLLSYLARTDRPFQYLCLAHLALVALAPFGVAIFGSAPQLQTAQWTYDAMLFLLAASLLVLISYAASHPALSESPNVRALLVPLRLRYVSLCGCAVLSALIASRFADWYGVPFLALILTNRIATRMEHRQAGRMHPPDL